MNTTIPVMPRRYKVVGHSGFGYFDPVEVTVDYDQSATATLVAQRLGELEVNYAESDQYQYTPDRAFAYPISGQELQNGFMRPGVAKKVLPGRYRIEGRGSDVAEQQVTVRAGEKTVVTLKPITE